MKIIVASGGLGNMMFQYALVLAYRAKGIKTLLFVSEGNAEHNGYELEHVFSNVKPYKGVNIITKIYYKFLGFLRRLTLRGKRIPHPLLFFPFKAIRTKEAVLYYPEIANPSNKSCFLIGQFQSYKYFEHVRTTILHEYSFCFDMLSEKTKEVYSRINNSNSVSIHIRRGDYLETYFYTGLGSVCNEDYYKRAIQHLDSCIKNITYFIFSDDKDYVTDHYNLSNMVIVDFNKGSDSWQDMFLMSKCKHNIIANSTFSWWAAYLNTNQDKVVVAPSRWWGPFEKDDVVPPEWIRL